MRRIGIAVAVVGIGFPLGAIAMVFPLWVAIGCAILLGLTILVDHWKSVVVDQDLAALTIRTERLNQLYGIRSDKQ